MTNTTANVVDQLNTLRAALNARPRGGSQRDRAKYDRAVRKASLTDRVAHLFAGEAERISLHELDTYTEVRYQNGRGHIGGLEDVHYVAAKLGVGVRVCHDGTGPSHLASVISFYVPKL